MPATKNTPSTHHPRRRNVTTLMVGLKKRSHTQKSDPKVVNPRDIAGERKKNPNKQTNKQKKNKKNKDEFAVRYEMMRKRNEVLLLTGKSTVLTVGERKKWITGACCVGMDLSVGMDGLHLLIDKSKFDDWHKDLAMDRRCYA